MNLDDPILGAAYVLPVFFLGLSLVPIVTVPAAVTAIVDPGLFADAGHAAFDDQTPVEQKLSEALHRALGIDVSVRCAPSWEESDEAITEGRAFSLLGLHTIRLVQGDVCDKLAGDINVILSGAPFGRDVDRKSDIVDAIETVAHEGAHIKYGADGEDITECQGYQDAPDVARALGATDSSMEEVMYMLPFSHNERTDPYMTTADCADGGLYDLHPDQVGGIFPTPGRLG